MIRTKNISFNYKEFDRADELEPKDRAQLVRALCGLLDQQRIARGEPLPGSRKPAADKPLRSAAPGAWLEPALPEPAPAPAQVISHAHPEDHDPGL